MRLQFLGDSRDAFKWDLLQWLVTRAQPPFSQLLFVPMLTPDVPGSRHGRTPAARFPARPVVLDFVGQLRGTPEGVEAVRRLGRIEAGSTFEVRIHAPRSFVPEGPARPQYWQDLEPAGLENTLVFLDPDNGFETKSQKGDRWVLDAEIHHLLNALPASSAVVVYQQRPRLPWREVFRILAPRLDYAVYASAVHNAALAFVLLAGGRAAAERLNGAALGYVQRTDNVQHAVLQRWSG